MEITITTRHFEGLTDALRDDIESRIGKVEKFFDHIVEAKAILTQEKHRHIAEVTIHMPAGTRLVSKEEAGDMWAAVDLAVKKIESQVKKFKERKRERKRTSIKDLEAPGSSAS